jgi:sugar phosphate isomerase/epimerase
MRLGIVTYNIARDWDLETTLRVLAQCGLDGLELRTTHRHGVEPDAGRPDRVRIRDRLREAGLGQVSLGSTCEFHASDTAEVRRNIEQCRAFVSLARDIGARAVKVRPNDLTPGEEAERVIERIGKALAECGRIGEEDGVEIWMEVHGRGTELPANARRILDACGHPNVGVTWNSNAADVVDGSVRQSFRLLGSSVRCCHVGELWSGYPWRELFSLLAEASFEGYALAELPLPFTPEAGVAFLRCYRALWDELRRQGGQGR